jgi:hypothetical protein
MYKNFHGKGHELPVPILANTNVFDNMSNYRKTIGEIILVHELKISLLSSKIPKLHQYKNTSLIQSNLSHKLFDFQFSVDFQYFIDTLLYIPMNTIVREPKCGQCLWEIMNEWLNEK